VEFATSEQFGPGGGKPSGWIPRWWCRDYTGSNKIGGDSAGKIRTPFP